MVRIPIVEFDHLVVGAATLAAGVEYIAEVTGVRPVAGGRHVLMGTHNALLRLAPRAYLEIIAIDPEVPAPTRKRFFDLDDPVMTALLAAKPKLIHWVARTTDLARAAAACPIALGRLTPMERGALRWTLTIRDDGTRPGAGVVPSLIEWEADRHPAPTLPESGVTLAQIAAAHPEPEPIRTALAAIGLAGQMATTYDRKPRLAAMLRTPRGLVTL